MDLEWLDKVRLFEIRKVIEHIPAGTSSVLEIGAGTGLQTRALADAGLKVEAVELKSSLYRESRVFPVREYDGRTLPFPDGSFDLVYTSNVLEHVDDLSGFQDEIRRVLHDGGRAIHVVPSAAWRIWTIVTHYPAVLRRILRKVTARPATAAGVGGSQGGNLSLRGKLMADLVPLRHGVRGNALSELFYFSRNCWEEIFRGAGWKIEEIRELSLLYSGNILLGASLPVALRKRLARVLGSSTVMFVVSRSG